MIETEKKYNECMALHEKVKSIMEDMYLLDPYNDLTNLELDTMRLHRKAYDVLKYQMLFLAEAEPSWGEINNAWIEVNKIEEMVDRTNNMRWEKG